MKRAAPVPLWVSLLVTTISFAPPVPAGVVAAMVVAVITPTVALTPPMVTLAPAMKPVPVIVIEVPPEVLPDVGLTEVTAGGGGSGVAYVNNAVPVPLCKSLLVTTISFAPAVPAGVVRAIVVAVMAPTAALAPPMVTLAPAKNPVPVIVIDVPPEVLPDAGLTEVMVGAGCAPVRI